MPTINLTLAEHSPEWVSFLQELFLTFGRERNMPVHAESFTWSEIRKKLVDIGINKSSADVSEAGSSWVPSLVSMNSLRPFQATEIARIRGNEIFNPASWNSITLRGSDEVWSLPFTTDVRVIYYWRDMLEKAGIEENGAFATPDAMLTTLERLKTVVLTPLVMRTAEIVFTSASWLWSVGCDFVSPDGKTVLLNEPIAHEALQKYFQLTRFLTKNESPTLQTTRDIFFDRQAAVTISGSWFAHELWQQNEAPPAWGAQLGISPMPGPSFVGGTNLIIWKLCQFEREAVQLVESLISPQIQSYMAHYTSAFPATRLAMTTLVQSKEHAKPVVYAIETGRSLPATPLWGLTEQRITEAFNRIWQQLRETPDTNIPELLSKQLPVLTRRLDTILAG
jgi:multiple sugar transport system substrate-binding protein